MQVWPQFMYLPQAMRLGKARAGRVQSPRPCDAFQRRLNVFQLAVKTTSTYMYLVILIKKKCFENSSLYQLVGTEDAFSIGVGCSTKQGKPPASS